MEKSNTDFQYGNLSDVGRVRTENQDYYGRYQGDYGQLIVVCDGMGGYEGGAMASRLAVEAMAEHFKRLGRHYDPRFELEQAYIAAQKSLKEYSEAHPETNGMGTTAVVLLILDGQYWFANTGDSRMYLKRGAELIQLTKDHSLVQNMVDSGILTEAQAAEHPKRNIITKALGTQNFIPDISGPYTLYQNDTFMLCSDGLYHYFSLAEMSAILDKEPQLACETLVDLANQQGSDDNVTVQIVRSNLGNAYAQIPSAHPKWKWPLILAGISLLLFFSSWYLAKAISSFLPKKATTEISKDKPKQQKDSKTTAKTTEDTKSSHGAEASPKPEKP